MKPVKLIVCDIEGCLMPGDKGAAGEGSLLPIAEYCSEARGDSKLAPLVLCTGRQAPYAECLAQVIGAFFPGFPSVVENGAMLYDIARNDIRYSPLITDNIKHRRHLVGAQIDGIIAETGAVLEPGKSICISLNPPKGMAIEALYIKVMQYLKHGMEGLIITHSRSAVDITPLGIDKAHGIVEIAKVTGIDPADMLGIGDTTGDLPMLKLVGHPACPANATDEVKAVCKYVAKESESKGVAEILKHFTEWE